MCLHHLVVVELHELAEHLLYVSHETFTCARNGGCAGAEVTALRAAFGEDVRKVLITNSKGMTGHAMGVCFEDAVAVAALSTGLAPPVVHHREADPVLGSLRLSDGAAHDCRYALHFAAGGDHVTTIDLLLARGAGIDVQNGFGWTPLMSAAALNCTGAIRRLLDEGANRQLKSKAGQKAAAIAQKYAKLDAYSLLCNYTL